MRRAGYRLLGPGFDYLLHTRPAEWPIMAAHTLMGYLLAVGLQGAWSGERFAPAVLGLGLWVICLNGGTLALNSAYDRDEGDVAYLRRPPPPPRHLAGFGLLLMFSGLSAAFLLPTGYRVAYAVCLVLSVLYSVPPVRLKAVPGADWVINMWGFGTLTPYAGWAATGLPVRPAYGLVLLGFCPLFAALYPLTQIYQFEEDSRRGDRTLARSLGVKGSLLVSLGAAAVGFSVFATAGRVAGWSAPDAWRWLALGLCALVWGAVLINWLRGHERMGVKEHQRGMYLALAAWAVTDLAVVVTWST
ncbi:MAG: UbiA prenyltransferase family protein [Gemmatimonadales bacterium]|nr:UbiA prenyltransferase family protein [Gemmatimonadales bacterium]